MAVVTYKINGMKETSKALDQLTVPKFRKAALRKAGKTAMSPVLSALKSAAPVWTDTSTLPKGAAPAALKNDLKQSISVNVEPRVGKSGKVTKASMNELKVTIKTSKKTEDYALVSEYGREEHSFTKYTVFGKPVLGFTATLPKLTPKPWMRTTFDGMQKTVSKTFANELSKAIIFQAAKQKKYQGK